MTPGPESLTGAPGHARPSAVVPVGAGVIRILAFALLIGVLAFGFDRMITHGMRSITTSTFGVWNRIVDGQINADILITGSSRAVYHYDPSVIQKATGRSSYNIGLNGSQIDMQVARLRTYLAHNRKPTLIVHNLDLFTFQVSHGEVYDPGQYIPYLREETLYAPLRKIHPQIWKARALPLYGYVVEDLRFTWVSGLGALLGRMPPEDRPLGFSGRHLVWTAEFDEFRALHANGVRVEIEPDGVRALEELIHTCRDQGIELMFVYSPEYREMKDLTLNRSELFGRFRELSVKNGILFIDFSDSEVSAHRENFYNSQHLNEDGAATFSRLLADRISSAFPSTYAAAPGS
jgi:hypothetical protein